VTESFPSANGLPPLPDQTPAIAQTKRWRWWIHLALIGAYPLLGVVLRSVTGHVVIGPALSGNVRGLLIVSGVEIILFALVFGLGWLASRASREELLFRWRPGWWVVPLGVAYSVAIRLALVVLIAVVVLIVLATQTATPETLQGFVQANRPDVETLVSVPAMRNDPAYFWLTLTLVSFVVAGLREEIWRAGTLAAMRALWPSAFASRSGQCAAVTLIAVLFGAMHLTMGPIAAVMAGVLGWLLGMIMVLHKSIWPAVTAHGLFDATTLAILPWSLEKLQHVR
jgi:membrane protease YdiL (CAAX protease family)